MRKGKTIQAIKAELQHLTSLEELAQHPDFQDERKGVQQAFVQRQRQLEKKRYNNKNIVTCVYTKQKF